MIQASSWVHELQKKAIGQVCRGSGSLWVHVLCLCLDTLGAWAKFHGRPFPGSGCVVLRTRTHNRGSFLARGSRKWAALGALRQTDKGQLHCQDRLFGVSHDRDDGTMGLAEIDWVLG
jgi:hypothetical protein